jgi:hypothetical protein
MRLFHVSDDPAIVRFEPRPARDGALKVWAIEERMACNYLLPRDCPRVCFRATGGVESHLLEGADAVVAIEAAWLERVRTAVLFRYELPTAGFALEDLTAGYWTSAEAVTPLRVDRITDPPERIAEAGARLVVLPSLWPLHDEVMASGLDFSMIRMRNAAPRS